MAVIGAAGRMGRTVCEAVESAPDLELVARLDVGDDVAALAGTADVGVDFTVPDAAEANVTALRPGGRARRRRHHGLGRAGDAACQGPADGDSAGRRDRAELRPVGGAGHAVRRAGGAVVRVGRGRRAASPGQGRRTVGHGGAHRPRDRTGTPRRRRRTLPRRHHVSARRRPRGRRRRRTRARGPVARARGARGDPARQSRRDADDPHRLLRPFLVHARRAARGPAGPPSDRV